jgi:hypothetical protein
VDALMKTLCSSADMRSSERILYRSEQLAIEVLENSVIAWIRTKEDTLVPDFIREIRSMMHDIHLC